jgi:hypothetical protein
MRLLSVLLLLAAAVAPAQEQPSSEGTQPLPNREKALENALRNLMRERAQPQPRAKPADVVPGRASCGYIRVFPAAPGIDPGIVVPDAQPKPAGQPPSGMPVYKGLPPCDLQAR